MTARTRVVVCAACYLFGLCAAHAIDAGIIGDDHERHTTRAVFLPTGPSGASVSAVTTFTPNPMGGAVIVTPPRNIKPPTEQS